jgi:recombination protein RecA
MEENKRKSLENALKTIEKEFGKGAVMRLGEMPKLQVDVIPTGSLGLDLALGSGASPGGGWWRSTGRSRGARPLWP